MDTRLSVLLQEAIGLKNGDAKIIKNAGAIIPSLWDSAMRSLIVAVNELGVKEIMVVAHSTLRLRLETALCVSGPGNLCPGPPLSQVGENDAGGRVACQEAGQ